MADVDPKSRSTVTDEKAMRVLSLDEAAKLLSTSDLREFFEDVSWGYADPVPNYRVPIDSGRKISLARVIANVLLEHGPFLLWFTETGVWPSSEHIQLLDRYRMSFGEFRSVHEAPVHWFDASERDDAISVLSLGLFFVWNLEIVTADRSTAVTISHDEWIEIRFAPHNREVAARLENRFVDLLP